MSALDLATIGACQIDTVPYPMPTLADLEQTVRDVEDCGGRVVFGQVDVRNRPGLESLVVEGIKRFGGIDIVLANGGISPEQPDENDPDAIWRDVRDINVTGGRNTVRAALPSMIDRGQGDSVVFTSVFA